MPCFTLATAALLHRGIKRRSHQGVIAAFGQTFVKSGMVEPRLHGNFAEIFDLRQDSDYRPVVRVTDKQAREVLAWARELVAVCRKLCE
jgi:uncharacterized protein (UPF0332 family)